MRTFSIIALLSLIISTQVSASDIDDRYYSDYEVYSSNYKIDKDNRIDFSDPIIDAVIQNQYNERYKEIQRRQKSPIKTTKKRMAFSVVADSKISNYGLTAAMVAGSYITYINAEDDKKKHFIVGALVGGVATTLARVYFKGDDYADLKSFLVGAGSALLIGTLKEIYDSTGRGTVDTMDAVYTALPGAAVALRIAIPL